MDGKIVQLRSSVDPVFETDRKRAWIDRARFLFGALLNKGGIPGAVQPFEYADTLTGTVLELRNTELFTILRVDGREYYFTRVTGKLDGTGSGCP